MKKDISGIQSSLLPIATQWSREMSVQILERSLPHLGSNIWTLTECWTHKPNGEIQCMTDKIPVSSWKLYSNKEVKDKGRIYTYIYIEITCNIYYILYIITYKCKYMEQFRYNYELLYNNYIISKLVEYIKKCQTKPCGLLTGWYFHKVLKEKKSEDIYRKNTLRKEGVRKVGQFFEDVI